MFQISCPALHHGRLQSFDFSYISQVGETSGSEQNRECQHLNVPYIPVTRHCLTQHNPIRQSFISLSHTFSLSDRSCCKRNTVLYNKTRISLLSSWHYLHTMAQNEFSFVTKTAHHQSVAFLGTLCKPPTSVIRGNRLQDAGVVNS